MQTEIPTTAVDTNEEYITSQNAVKEPAVLGTVFRAVIIETIKDFFGSIFGFFFRYIKHFLRSFLYFWSPTLRKKPFDKLDYKENCQHSFELALLVLFMIIFAVKLEWIPETSTTVLDWLNNDLSQMGVQFALFLVFAILYFLLAIFSILLGRVFRFLFRIKITKRESDILFIYLNNAFFSIASIIALCVRSITSTQFTSSENLGNGLSVIFFSVCFILVLLWAIRFTSVQKLGWVKGIIFSILSIFIFTFLFGFGGAMAAIAFMLI